MRDDYCDITVVLDRSGSMDVIRKDTIGGFNTFLTDQQRLPGKATLSLIQFDTAYEVNYDGAPIKDVKPLEMKTYEPRGATALLDALGRAIINAGTRLGNLPEAERPSKVIVCVITDGEENSSREFKNAQIKDMVRLQTDVYKWEFVFIGANIDAFAAAGSIGVAALNTMQTANTPDAVNAYYSSLTSNTASYRAGSVKTMAWTQKDKEKQEKAAKS